LDIKNPEAKIEIKDITNIKDEIKKPTANTNAKSNLYIKTKNDQIKLEFDNEKKLKEFKGVITK
jgi:hypothetical protein